MDFSEVIGQQHIKSHLIKTVENERIPHTQLFIGNTGSGILSLALSYAKEILCHSFKKGSDEYVSCANKIEKLAHPDLHFVYPVNTNEDIKKNPISDALAKKALFSSLARSQKSSQQIRQELRLDLKAPDSIAYGQIRVLHDGLMKH